VEQRLCRATTSVTVALVARGRTEIATKELTSIKRTARGEAEAEATAERVK
jgi:hypothetical protein